MFAVPRFWDVLIAPIVEPDATLVAFRAMTTSSWLPTRWVSGAGQAGAVSPAWQPAHAPFSVPRLWPDPDPQLRAAAQPLDPAMLHDDALTGLLQIAGLSGDDGFALPERTAPTSTLLEVAPPRLVEWLLRGAQGPVLTSPPTDGEVG